MPFICRGSLTFQQLRRIETSPASAAELPIPGLVVEMADGVPTVAAVPVVMVMLSVPVSVSVGGGLVGNGVGVIQVRTSWGVPVASGVGTRVEVAVALAVGSGASATGVGTAVGVVVLQAIKARAKKKRMATCRMCIEPPSAKGSLRINISVNRKVKRKFEWDGAEYSTGKD